MGGSPEVKVLNIPIHHGQISPIRVSSAVYLLANLFLKKALGKFIHTSALDFGPCENLGRKNLGVNDFGHLLSGCRGEGRGRG